MFDPDTIGWTIGVAFCTLVAAQLFIHLMSATSTWAARNRASRIRLDMLRADLDIVRHRRRITPRGDRSWLGFRRFVIRARIRESDDAISLYLVPQDRQPLPAYFPGQFVTLRTVLDDGETEATRCYSLSDRPREEFYRCTVKDLSSDSLSSDNRASDNRASENRADDDAFRERADGGVPQFVSRHLNRTLKQGDVVELQAPAGEFTMDLFERRPAVLLAAGIGITPLMSMIKTVCHEQTDRQLILFYGVRNSGAHVMAKELAQLESDNQNLRVVTCYSQPFPEDRPGKDFDTRGRITIELIKKSLESNNYEYFLCGPAGFLESLRGDLIQWQVPQRMIHLESFGSGPSKARTKSAPQAQFQAQFQSQPQPLPQSQGDLNDSNSGYIRFSERNQSVVWNNTYESILEAAEAQDVDLPFNCRKGNCGTCLLRIQSGSVSYSTTPAFDVSDSECLTCLARPTVADLNLEG